MVRVLTVPPEVVAEPEVELVVAPELAVVDVLDE
jgi:hypothetical protein